MAGRRRQSAELARRREVSEALERDRLAGLERQLNAEASLRAALEQRRTAAAARKAKAAELQTKRMGTLDGGRSARFADRDGADPWRERGACTREDPDLWFSGRPADVVKAVAVCGSCPVAGRCLAWATASRQAYGVWGGVDFEATARERIEAGRKRKRHTEPSHVA
jgi:WhiB family redox-sensing transcriptional regulator